MIELRQRLIYSLLAILVGFAVSYAFAPQIYEFLVRPLAQASEGEHRRLIYTGLTEAFTTYIKLALWTGCFAAFPVVAAQIWMFVAPGLYKNERKAFLPFLVATPVFSWRALRSPIMSCFRWLEIFPDFEMPGTTETLADSIRSAGQRIFVAVDDGHFCLWLGV